MGFHEFGNDLTPQFRLIKAWGGQLFVGTGLAGNTLDAQIWRSQDGTAWDRVFDSALEGKGRNVSVRAMAPFGAYLYAGMGTEFIGSAKIFRSLTGQDWDLIVGDGFGKPHLNNHVYALGVFEGQLYAGTFNLAGAQVYRSSDGESWELVAKRGFGDPRNLYIYELRVFQPPPESRARLVAITGPNPRGGQVWAYDGVTWSLIAPKGFGKLRNTDLWQAIQFLSDFYVGTFKEEFRRASKLSNDKGAELWRFDHSAGEWIAETTDGFGNPANIGIRVIFPWQGALYVGTQNVETGCELWKGTPHE